MSSTEPSTLEASQAAKDKADEADPDQTVTPDDVTLIVVMKYDPGNPLGQSADDRGRHVRGVRAPPVRSQPSRASLQEGAQRRGGCMKRLMLALCSLLTLGACATGIDAGGESLGENGGVAFILLTVMLLVVGAILWWIMGRED